MLTAPFRIHPPARLHRPPSLLPSVPLQAYLRVLIRTLTSRQYVGNARL